MQAGCISQGRVTAPFPHLTGSSLPAMGRASGLRRLWELCGALGHPLLLSHFLSKVRQALKHHPGLSVEVFIKCVFSCLELNQNLTGDAVFILKLIHLREQLWLWLGAPRGGWLLLAR